MPSESHFDTKIGIVGEEDAVAGFKALGLKVYSIKDTKQARAVIDEAVNDGVGICLVEESVYKNAQGGIEEYRGSPLPVFIPFSKNGTTKELDLLIKDIRLRATGTI